MNAKDKGDTPSRISPDDLGLFRAIFEQAAVGVAQIETATGRFIRVNQRYADIVGYSRQELERLDFQTLTHPEDLPAHLGNMRRLVAGEIREFTREQRHVRSDAAVVWVNLTVSPLWAPGEPPRFHVAVVEDISERKRAAAALQQQASEQAALNALSRAVNASLALEQTTTAALQSLLHALRPDLVFLFLREGDRLIFQEVLPPSARQRWSKVPEHRVGECLCGLAVREGRPIFSRDIFNDHRCTWEECKQAALKSFAALPLRSGDEIIGVIGLASETERDFAQQAGFLETLAGQVSMALAKARLFQTAQEELAERKRAEETLRASEDRYRLLVEESPDGIGIYQEGKLVFVNSTAARVFGAESKEALLGQTSERLIHPDDFAAAMDRVRRRLAGETGMYPAEVRYVRLDGTVFPVEVSASPTVFGGKPAVQFIARDITARKRMEDVQGFLARTSTGTADEPFFKALARYLAQSLSMDFICIDRLEGDGLTARTVAVWSDGHFQDNVTYALKNTPCGDVVGKTVCCFPARVRELFPRDAVLQDLRAESYVGVTLWSHAGQPIGLIAVIGQSPLVNREVAEATLKLVAVRAAGELERMEALQALRESECRYRILFEQSPDAVVVMDPETTLPIDFNDEACRQLGYTREEFARLRIADYEADQPTAEIQPSVAQCLAKGSAAFEVRHRTKQGELRNVWVSVQTLEAGGRRVFYSIWRDITERKRAEEKLAHSHDLLRYIIEHNRSAVAVHDRDMRYIYVSQRYLDEYHVQEPDIIGKHHYEVFPDLPQKWRDVHQKVLAGAVMSGEDDPYERADGSVEWTRWECRPWHEADGSIGGLIVYTEVITQRRKAELLLRARAELADTSSAGSLDDLLQRALDMGEMLTDSRIGFFHFVDADQENLTLQTWSTNTLKKMCTAEGKGRHYPVSEAGVWVDCLRTKAPVIHNDYASLSHKKGLPPGHAPVIREAVVPIVRDGLVTCLLGVGNKATDYTAEDVALLEALASIVADLALRKQAEVALQESEQRFRAIFNATFQFMGLMTPDGTLTEANQAALDFAGIQFEEAIDRPFWETHWWRGDEARVRQLREAITRAAAGEFVRYEVEWQGVGTTTALIDFSLKPVLNSAGQVTLLVPEGRDITERKRGEKEREKLQSQLTQAQKMESVGRLAGGVAHDFNNMLQAILGNAALALEVLPPESRVRDHLEEIQKSAQRSADLTRQLLAFARKQTIAPKVLDLNDTVAGMLKMLRRLIGEDIQLAWLPGVDLWPVKMDPSQVDQILANLCLNARDAIADTGKVTIETDNVTLDDTYAATHPDCVAGDYVLLAVSDTGVGMDAATQSHLFEPFFTTKELGKGTGLGLATVFGIVKQNHGLINVYSELGQGTTFKIYLPRAKAAAVVSGPESPGRSQGGTETVLVVEDEEQILNLSRLILTGHGYTVLTASTPEAALALVARHPGPVHLLITDIIMPGMNGKQLRDRLQASHPHLKCLFMSGYTADVIVHHGVLDETVDFLQKPFTNRTLADKVREMLTRELQKE